MNELSDDVWNQIETLVSKHEVKEITADYSGDLMFADRKRGKWLNRYISLKVPLSLATHANDLTPEVARLLMQSRLISINFSLDSMDPIDYPKIRVGARPLAEVLANIANFMRLRNESRPDITTYITFVLMKRNLSSIHGAVDFANEHGITYVQFSHLMVFTPDMVEQSVLLDIDHYRDVYTEALAYASERGVELLMPPPLTIFRPRSGHTPCKGPWHVPLILGNGDVMACCMPGTVVGNLSQDTLEGVWNGARMREFRERVNTNNPPEPCDRCGFLRHENNFESYVPGLAKEEREKFVSRVLSQFSS